MASFMQLVRQIENKVSTCIQEVDQKVHTLTLKIDAFGNTVEACRKEDLPPPIPFVEDQKVTTFN